MIHPGEVFYDTAGQPIQAHGGCILRANGRYYWYGEDNHGETKNRRIDIVGIHAYVSDDCEHWDDLGVVLPSVPGDAAHDLHPSNVAERPKVLFCAKTGQYVMWLHIDDATYHKASVGVAIASRPEGPFHYVRSFRPNGVDSRDMTLFQEEDGTAYLLHSSDWNRTLIIARLTCNYLDLDGAYTRVFIDQTREAPAVVKHGDTYYMLTSGCTGWHPNPTLYATSKSMLGHWRLIDNPCEGPEKETTYRSQSTWILTREGADGPVHFYMGDRWNPDDLADSRYVWLPIEWDGGRMRIPWRDAWDFADYCK